MHSTSLPVFCQIYSHLVLSFFHTRKQAKCRAIALKKQVFHYVFQVPSNWSSPNASIGDPLKPTTVRRKSG